MNAVDDYQQAWQFLDQLQLFKIKLGLDSMNHFLARLGNPQSRLKCIHIAGTNGKGSVGATLHSLLTAAGYKTGFYTSPHLSSVRERFKIDDTYISKKDFARLISKIEAMLDGRQITYFECTTALALLWFAEQEVDFAVLEVGMGGRLDATNVVTPLVSIITNVSMDHEQHLGDTLAKIATEKAGIIKQGVPVVSAVADDDSGEVIRQTCAERQAPLLLFGRDFDGNSDGNVWQYRGLDGQKLHNLPMPLKGGHQISNCSLALAAVQLLQRLLQRQGWTMSEEHVRIGLAQTRWPGRLEYFRTAQGQQFLLDGAHNPAGAAALKAALINDFPRQRLLLVWGAMADKDIQTTLRDVAPLADVLILTKAAESERAAHPKQLAAVLPETLQAKATCAASVQVAIEQAKKMATQDDLICISGSLYLIGTARRLLLGGLTDEEE
ncbi:bifunctional folylpolyglutamate synthase/dihydrofolate synthase [Desulfobulbus sp. F5]|nr:bifunctional folylpolyglutamate synthase/dihydrofolate synthase [Desulfobulbus sp. F5]